jgi:hypothetical protein
MASSPVSIAILIIAHKNLPQVKRLVAHLQADFDVFVHLDRRSDIQVSDFREFVRTKVIKKFKATWGSLGIVHSTLELFMQASRSGSYDRYVLISGQDVPLQTNQDITSFFTRHAEVDFVDSNPFTAAEESRLTRIAHFHFFPRRTFSDTLTRRLADLSRWLDRFIELGGIRRSTVYRFRWGSQWMDLRSETVQKMLEFVRTDSRFLHRFRYTFCPDEVFFQSAIENCGITEAMTAEPSRFIDWKTGPEHPRVLRLEDLERLQGSAALFARKCDTSVDADLNERLWARLEAKR